MNKSLDDVLRYALYPQDEADGKINQTILSHLKEDSPMKSYQKKLFSVAVLATILILCFSSVTAYAAWKYLTPDKIAENIDDQKLAEAFLSENAIIINESQTYGNYQTTLLSIVSGNDLSNYNSIFNGSTLKDRSYIVVALEYADGTPMPDISEDAYDMLEFCVSPLIKGYDPLDVNVYTFNSNHIEISQDGVLYRLLECDNLMLLANYEVYLAISDTFFPDRECYSYDSITGTISRNEDYDGLNALFFLPLDNSLANEEAAAKLLEDLSLHKDIDTTEAVPEGTNTELSQEEGNNNIIPIPNLTTTNDFAATISDVAKWVSQLTSDNLEYNTERLEETVQILHPTEDGYLEIKYQLPNKVSGELRRSLSADMEVNHKYIIGSGHSGTFESLILHVISLNEDGSYTYAIYLPKIN